MDIWKQDKFLFRPSSKLALLMTFTSRIHPCQMSLKIIYFGCKRVCSHTQSIYSCSYLKDKDEAYIVCPYNWSSVDFVIIIFQDYSPSEYLLRGKVTIQDRKTCTETYGAELTPRLMCTFDKKDGPCVVSAADAFLKVLCRCNVHNNHHKALTK